MNFLERLDDEARAVLLRVARPMRYSNGERLLRYGDPSRGAYVLSKGAAEASVLLPGGEKLAVAMFEAGALFGETALVERGTCTATVTAADKLEGWFIERDEFRSLVAQRSAATMRIQHALTQEISRKLRALNARVMEVPAPWDKPKSGALADSDPLASVKRLEEAPFDLWPFLPQLAFFEEFDPGEIAAIVSMCSLLELPSGHAVFWLGHLSRACFIVVRGAVEVRARHAGRERRMAVLGPGQFLGYMSALDRTTHGSDAIVREQALLLEIPRQAFEKFYYGPSHTTTKLHRVIQKNLLYSLGETNRHLTRLLSLARLRGAAQEGDELEKAYGGQIVSGARAA